MCLSNTFIGNEISKQIVWLKQVAAFSKDLGLYVNREVLHWWKLFRFFKQVMWACISWEALWFTCWNGGYMLGPFWFFLLDFILNYDYGWWISCWTMIDLMMDYDGYYGYMMLRLIMDDGYLAELWWSSWWTMMDTMDIWCYGWFMFHRWL